jgi:predicted phosphodiesterase
MGRQSVADLSRGSSAETRVVRVPGIEGKASLTVGVLADTHLPFRLKRLPDQIPDLFRGVDMIVHAGDVDQLEHLHALQALAPLYAVRGNLHFKPTELSHGGLELPFELRFSLLGHRVIVNHGGWPNFWALAGDWFWEKMLERERKRANARIGRRLLRMYPEADVIIFGHTHRPYNTWHEGTLLFNPGGVAPGRKDAPSVGRLELSPGHVEATIIPLGPLECAPG